jgi:hypothetical protein
MIFQGLLLCFLCVLFGNIAKADSFGLITGPNHLYVLIIPENWKMDREYAQSIGFPAPYFLRPFNVSGSKTYIYSIGHETKTQPLEDFVKLSQKNIQDAVGNLTIMKKEVVKTKDNSTAQIYHYTGFKDNRIEDVAFLKTKSLICVIAFSTREVEKYKTYYEDFLRVVKSFHFISDKPQNINGQGPLK